MTATAIVRRSATIASLVAVAALLAACGSSKSNGTSGAGSSTEGGRGTTSNGAGFEPVTGKVVSVGSSGAGVETTSGRTNVAFSATTRFTAIDAINRSALKVGECVTATSKSASPGTTGTSGTSGTTVDASSVVVTGITCTTIRNFGGGATGGQGFGSGGGGESGFPGGTPPTGGAVPGGTPPTGEGFTGGTRPSFAPGAGRGGFGSGTRARFGGAVGTITSISAGAIEVKSEFPSATTSTGSTGGTGTRTITVATSSVTTYSSRTTGKVGAVTTGRCVTAVGQKASNGVVDAFAVTVSAPVNGQCKAGSTAFGGGFFAGAPGANSSSGSVNG